jgi:hypothetical protein
MQGVMTVSCGTGGERAPDRPRQITFPGRLTAEAADSAARQRRQGRHDDGPRSSSHTRRWPPSYRRRRANHGCHLIFHRPFIVADSQN